MSKQENDCTVCGTKKSPAAFRLTQLLSTDPCANFKNVHPADFMGQSTADAARKKHEEEVLRLKIIVEERAAADVIKNKVAVLQGLLSGLQVELSDKEEFIKYILEASPKWVSKAAAYRGIGQ